MCWSLVVEDLCRASPSYVAIIFRASCPSADFQPKKLVPIEGGATEAAMVDKLSDVYQSPQCAFYETISKGRHNWSITVID